MPRSKLRWNAPAKHEPETGPFAIEVNAFCERHTVGRSKAYGLVTDSSLVAKKMGSKTLVDVRSARSWYGNLPVLQSKAKL